MFAYIAVHLYLLQLVRTYEFLGGLCLFYFFIFFFFFFFLHLYSHFHFRCFQIKKRWTILPTSNKLHTSTFKIFFNITRLNISYWMKGKEKSYYDAQGIVRIFIFNHFFFKKGLNMRVQHALLVCTWFDIMFFLTCHALETRLRVWSESNYWLKDLSIRGKMTHVDVNSSDQVNLPLIKIIDRISHCWYRHCIYMHSLSVPIVPFGNERECVDAHCPVCKVFYAKVYERCINRRGRKAVDVNRMTKLKWFDRMRESRTSMLPM